MGRSRLTLHPSYKGSHPRNQRIVRPASSQHDNRARTLLFTTSLAIPLLVGAIAGAAVTAAALWAVPWMQHKAAPDAYGYVDGLDAEMDPYAGPIPVDRGHHPAVAAVEASNFQLQQLMEDIAALQEEDSRKMDEIIEAAQQEIIAALSVPTHSITLIQSSDPIATINTIHSHTFNSTLADVIRAVSPPANVSTRAVADLAAEDASRKMMGEEEGDVFRLFGLDVSRSSVWPGGEEGVRMCLKAECLARHLQRQVAMMREQVEQADREVVAWQSLEDSRKEAATRGTSQYGGQRVSQLELRLSKAEQASEEARNLLSLIDAARHYEALFGQSLFDQSEAANANSERLQLSTSAALRRKNDAETSLANVQSHLRVLLRALSLRCDSSRGIAHRATTDGVTSDSGASAPPWLFLLGRQSRPWPSTSSINYHSFSLPPLLTAGRVGGWEIDHDNELLRYSALSSACFDPYCVDWPLVDPSFRSRTPLLASLDVRLRRPLLPGSSWEDGLTPSAQPLSSPIAEASRQIPGTERDRERLDRDSENAGRAIGRAGNRPTLSLLLLVSCGGGDIQLDQSHTEDESQSQSMEALEAIQSLMASLSRPDLAEVIVLVTVPLLTSAAEGAERSVRYHRLIQPWLDMSSKEALRDYDVTPVFVSVGGRTALQGVGGGGGGAWISKHQQLDYLARMARGHVLVFMEVSDVAGLIEAGTVEGRDSAAGEPPRQSETEGTKSSRMDGQSDVTGRQKNIDGRQNEAASVMGQSTAMESTQGVSGEGRGQRRRMLAGEEVDRHSQKTESSVASAAPAAPDHAEASMAPPAGSRPVGVSAAGTTAAAEPASHAHAGSAVATASGVERGSAARGNNKAGGAVKNAGHSAVQETRLPLLDELLLAFAGNEGLGVIGYRTSRPNVDEMTMMDAPPAVRESMQQWWEEGRKSIRKHDAAGSRVHSSASFGRVRFTGYVDGTPLVVRREALEAIGGMGWKVEGVVDEVLAGWILCTRMWLAGHQVGRLHSSRLKTEYANSSSAYDQLMRSASYTAALSYFNMVEPHVGSIIAEVNKLNNKHGV